MKVKSTTIGRKAELAMAGLEAKRLFAVKQVEESERTLEHMRGVLAGTIKQTVRITEDRVELWESNLAFYKEELFVIDKDIFQTQSILDLTK